MSEAFEEWWQQTRTATIAGCACQICHDRDLAVWRACEEHMRSSTRGLYYQCPGCGEFLAIPIKPHYCNVGLHVSSALTRADVPLCVYCLEKVDGPLLGMGSNIAHAECVVDVLNQLLDPDWEPV